MKGYDLAFSLYINGFLLKLKRGSISKLFTVKAEFEVKQDDGNFLKYVLLGGFILFF